ncbi:MAG: class I SAM-dependent methyltransferase, partial [Bacteroidota bacterium]
QRMRYESASQINRIEWHHFINGAFDSIQKLDMRMYFPKELDAYLSFCGFEIKHKFGTFEEAPFSDQSDKQIFVCR